MILFSGISPDFEETLKEERFGCFKYIHIPFAELDKMPIKDRKYYIRKHNKVTEKENAELQGNNETFSGEFINGFSDMSRQTGVLNRTPIS